MSALVLVLAAVAEALSDARGERPRIETRLHQARERRRRVRGDGGFEVGRPFRALHHLADALRHRHRERAHRRRRQLHVFLREFRHGIAPRSSVVFRF